MGPLGPRSRKAFPGCAEAEEEEGDAAQAELSRVVSINLGLALDCIMPCWGSLGDSAVYDSVSLSVNRANNNP